MSGRRCIAWFDNEDSILAAVTAARRAGYTIDDVYTPYAVHGMDEAMGLPPSRLRWVCLGCGLFGLTFGLLFQIWTSAVSWPLHVGGKPPFSAPSFVPVSFELMMLVAGLGTVAALLARTRLYPRLRLGSVLNGVTNDRFALVLATADAPSDENEKQAFCRRMRAIDVEFVEVSA